MSTLPHSLFPDYAVLDKVQYHIEHCYRSLRKDVTFAKALLAGAYSQGLTQKQVEDNAVAKELLDLKVLAIVCRPVNFSLNESPDVYMLSAIGYFALKYIAFSVDWSSV